MKLFYRAGLLCSLLAAVPAHACDICGCGVSNYNPYLFPHLARNYIGLTYIHRGFRTLPPDEAPAHETYRSFLLSGQVQVGKKLRLLALLPWQQNDLRSETGNRRLNGPGDITLLAQYLAWERSTERARQAILVGAGMKLAIGKFVPAGSEKAAEQNFQLGTGSYDFLVNGSYRLSLRRWTLAATASYKYNTANADGFRFGDVATAGLLAAWRQEWKRWSLTPYLQLSHESLQRDADRHVLQRHSGGTVFYAGGGVDVNTRSVTTGLNYQLAPDQSLAGGQIRVQPKFSAHASFAF